MIKMHVPTKEIYANRDGMDFKWFEKRMWAPCMHVPASDMVRLDEKAYPILYQSFDEKFASDAGCTALRLQCGMTQEQFAGLMGMTQQAVARLESGSRLPTKIHKQMLKCIEIINDAGLLEKLR